MCVCKVMNSSFLQRVDLFSRLKRGGGAKGVARRREVVSQFGKKRSRT